MSREFTAKLPEARAAEDPSLKCGSVYSDEILKHRGTEARDLN
jgi:hypothetical protein